MFRRRQNRMRWQSGRGNRGFRQQGQPFDQENQPLDSTTLELRDSLRKLADTINQTAILLDRFQGGFGKAEESCPDVVRDRNRLIPTRRSELLAKIDKERPARRQE